MSPCFKPRPYYNKTYSKPPASVCCCKLEYMCIKYARGMPGSSCKRCDNAAIQTEPKNMFHGIVLPVGT